MYIVCVITRCFACPLSRFFALHRRVAFFALHRRVALFALPRRIALFALPRRVFLVLWFRAPHLCRFVLRFARCIALSMVTELFSFGEFKINLTRFAALT